MPSEQPVFVLVHGAWQRPLHYIKLLTALQDAGFTVVAPPLPASGWTDRNARATLADDAEAVRQAMQPHLDAGKEIIVLCHSYGGLPATDAIVGNSVEERKARGEKGGIKAALYMAALAPIAPNLSLLGILGQDLLAGTPSYWDLPNDVQSGRLAVVNEKVKALLYDDLDEIVGQASFDACVPQSLASFESPCAHSMAEVKAAKIYIVTECDNSAPVDIQMGLAKANGMSIVTIQSGHSPFMTQKGVARLVDIIQEVVKAPVN